MTSRKDNSRAQLLADAAAGLRRLEEQRAQLVALQVSMPAPQHHALQPVISELTDTLAEQSQRLATLQADGVVSSRGPHPYSFASPPNPSAEVAKAIPKEVTALVEKLGKEVARLSLAAIGIVGAVEIAFKNDAALQDVEERAMDKQDIGTASRASRLLSPGPSRNAGARSSGLQACQMPSASSVGIMPSKAKDLPWMDPARQLSPPKSPCASPVFPTVAFCTASPERTKAPMCSLTTAQSTDNADSSSLGNILRSARDVASTPGGTKTLFLTSSTISSKQNEIGNLSANLSNWTMSTPRQLRSPREAPLTARSRDGEVGEYSECRAVDTSTSGKMSTPPVIPNLVGRDRNVKRQPSDGSIRIPVHEERLVTIAQSTSPCSSMATMSELGVSSLAPVSPSPSKMQSASEIVPNSDNSGSPHVAFAHQSVPIAKTNLYEKGTCETRDTTPTVEPMKSLTPPDLIGLYNSLMAQRAQSSPNSLTTSAQIPTYRDLSFANSKEEKTAVGAGEGNRSLPQSRPLSNGPSPRGPLRPPLQPASDIPGTTVASASPLYLPQESRESQGKSVSGLVTRSLSLPVGGERFLSGPGRNSSPRLPAQQPIAVGTSYSGASTPNLPQKSIETQDGSLSGLVTRSLSGNVLSGHGRTSSPSLITQPSIGLVSIQTAADQATTSDGRSYSQPRSSRHPPLSGPPRYSSPSLSRQASFGSQQNSPRLPDSGLAVSREALGSTRQSSPCSQQVVCRMSPTTLPMQSIPTKEQSLMEALSAPTPNVLPQVSLPARSYNQSPSLVSSLGTSSSSIQRPSPGHSPTVPWLAATGHAAQVLRNSDHSDSVAEKLLAMQGQQGSSHSWPDGMSRLPQTVVYSSCVQASTPTTAISGPLLSQLNASTKTVSEPLQTNAYMLMATTTVNPASSSTGLLQTQESTRTLSPQNLSPRSNSPRKCSPSSSSTTPSFSPSNPRRKSGSFSPSRFSSSPQCTSTDVRIQSPVVHGRSPDFSARRSPSRSPPPQRGRQVLLRPRASSPSIESRGLVAAPPSRSLSVVVEGVYVPDPKDWLDTLLSWCHKTLSPEIRGQLNIQRIRSGDYIIDGRRVGLRWGSLKRGAEADLLVQEQLADNEAETPLHVYLAQTANVVSSRSPQSSPRGLPRIIQTLSRDVPASARILSMEVNSAVVPSPSSSLTQIC